MWHWLGSQRFNKPYSIRDAQIGSLIGAGIASHQDTAHRVHCSVLTQTEHLWVSLQTSPVRCFSSTPRFAKLGRLIFVALLLMKRFKRLPY